jgi:predicted transcriptional regulator of viral defense system
MYIPIQVNITPFLGFLANPFERRSAMDRTRNAVERMLVALDAPIYDLLRYAGRQPVIRQGDLDRLRIPRNYLGRLVRAGKLERVGRGLYSSSENPPTENRTLVEVCLKMPQAVVCHSSALRFHELTTENLFEVWIALKQGAWTPRIEYPPIRVVRFSGPSLTFGAVEHTVEGTKIKVYSPAKTVDDCFKFRSKIGTELAIQVLR